MKRRNVLRTLAGAAGIVGVAGLTSATDCSGVSSWDAGATYQSGKQVAFEGSLWEAQWWTQGDQPGSSEWGPWEEVSDCDDDRDGDSSDGDDDGSESGGGEDDGGDEGNCGAISAWDAGTVYNEGEQVTFDGSIWEAQWYTQDDEPGSAQWGPWEEIGPCDEGHDGDDGDDGGGEEDAADGTSGTLPWGEQTLTPFQGTWDTAGDFVGQTLDAPVDRVNLAFVGDPTDGDVAPGWLSECQDGCDWEHVSSKADEVQAIQEGGVGVGVSIAGWDSPTLAGATDSIEELKDAYEELLDELGITHIDIDDENDSWERPESVYERRHDALAQLQDERPDLTVGYTVPADTGGIDNRDYARGRDMVRDALEQGVELEYVNIMTMHFDSDTTPEMVQSAAEGTVDWLGTVTDLSEETRWNMLGVTTAIENDGFSLADAAEVGEWAAEQGLGMVSFWALYSEGGQQYAETFAKEL